MEPLPTPDSFPFPYEEPYSIQKDFMKSLFRCLDEGKLGIFESPTGTGKSLSLICGALLWFKKRQEARLEYLKNKIEDKKETESSAEEEADWFAAAVKNRQENEKKMEYKLELKFLREKEERLLKLRRNKMKSDEKFIPQDKHENNNDFGSSEIDEDHDLILNDYFSDDDEPESSEIPEDDEDYSLRIYYSSRTHSQLSQFVKEVKKSPYADSIRLISLGSRKNTCIHDGVKRLKHNALINEKCLDLQKGSTKTMVDKEQRASKKQKLSNKCPFYSQTRIEALKNRALTEIIDIEELVSSGRKTQTCPYYSSRHASVDAELVVIPYNTLLHKSTREACGIKLKNSVVIIDEAHNLLETLSHIHSCEIKMNQLSECKLQLVNYLGKFRSRLKSKNLLYIKQLIFIVTNFLKILSTTRMMSTIDFLHESQIFNIDLFKILRYISRSKISFKLRGFSQKYAGAQSSGNALKTQSANSTQSFLQTMKKKQTKEVEEVDKTEMPPPNIDGSTPLNILYNFLQNILEGFDDGRILITHSESSSIKFLLLNPINHFKDLVKECHSIIVAGGTMEPVEEFKGQLFVSSGASAERIHHFSCGHVIPESNLLPIVLHHGPSGKLLDFSFSQRSLKESYDEILRLLSNVATITPGGIVVFFPSYDYEAKVHHFLSQSQVWNNLVSKKKPLFREPKTSDAVEGVLKGYARSVKHLGGAFLFSVVGGKMSEGINFSDDLGRCVIMIGLPFSNAGSIELQEKMEYLNKNQGPSAGKKYYENSCMKAVNQSIGRAIRHSNDYATIILADHRYSRDNISELLPKWIRDKMWKCDRFGSLVPKVAQFFKTKSV